jgi:YVTN family beta-propeller protein
VVSFNRFAGVKRGLFAVVVAAAGVLVFGGSALARTAYVTNSGSGTVSAIDTNTNVVIANVVVAGEPVDVAITPDGTRAYVANKQTNTVAVISTATNSQIGTIVVGKEPDGIAIGPGGQYAYVSNFGGGSVSLIDTVSNSVPIGPIQVGKAPQGVAVSPDGRFVYVALKSGGIDAIDTNGFSTVGSIGGDSLPHSRLAIGPRGSRGFATNSESASVTAFDPAARTVVGAPIGIGSDPIGIAIGPSGGVAYAASPANGAITPINTSLDVPLSGPVGGFPGASGVAIAPNGLQGYVTDGTGSSVTVLDAAANAAVGSIGVGSKPTGVAVVPDQAPLASFFVTPNLRRVKKRLTFHGAASSDADGQLADYTWDFGDGGRVHGSKQTRVHRYRQPGQYIATLTVTDDEGCSTEQVYTGQTASCNGSSAATISIPIAVVNDRGPVLQLAGGKRQRLRGRANVFARCPGEPCAVVARGTLVTVFKRHGKKRRRRLRLGGIRIAQPSQSWRRLGARLPRGRRRAAIRALRLGGRARVRVAVIAYAETGLRTLHRRNVELVLPGHRRR